MYLERPIAFLDLETTGTDKSKDKIVQIAIIKIFPDGNIEEKKKLINPGMPIPKEASDIHGITDEMVENCPPFSQFAKALSLYLSECDFGGYNSDRFDLPLLAREFERCRIEWPQGEFFTVDAYGIEKKNNSHKLGDVYKRYFDKDLDDAHDALVDVRATVEILMEQIDRYYKPEISVQELQAESLGDDERVDLEGCIYKKEDGFYFAFGKHKDKKICREKEILQYVDWMMRESSGFSSQTKSIINQILQHEAQKSA